MSDDHLAQVQAALASIPGLAAPAPGAGAVTRLGGLTNLVFRVEIEGGPYVLRLPGKGTEDYIDREVERHNAKIAAQAGVSAEVIHSDAGTGVMLTRCIEGIVTMTPELFASRAGAPERAGRALRGLHTCGRGF